MTRIAMYCEGGFSHDEKSDGVSELKALIEEREEGR